MTGRILAVTGTSTDVGKTIVTAALAAEAIARGESVAVVKPVQTGTRTGDPTDIDVVRALVGSALTAREFTTLPQPLAPDTAARLAGVAIPAVSAYVDGIVELAGTHDLVIVEGAGGLLVRLDTEEGTLLHLIELLTAHAPDEVAVDVVIVCAAGLGTLNHSELTVEALRARGMEPAGLVIGSWPADPGLAERCNLDDLPTITRLPVLALIPAGAGSLDPGSFRALAPSWFATASQDPA